MERNWLRYLLAVLLATMAAGIVIHAAAAQTPAPLTADGVNLEFTDIHFVPPPPSAADRVRVYACTQGDGGVGVTLKVSVNTAADGTDQGEWRVINELGVPCYNEIDAPYWGTLEFADGPHLVRVQARSSSDSSWDDALTAYRVYTLLPRETPAPSTLTEPPDQAQLTSPAMTFRWIGAAGANGYRLQMAVGDDPTDAPLIDVSLPADMTAYTAILPMQAQTYAWRVVIQQGADATPTDTWRFQIEPPSSEDIDTLILFPRQRMDDRYPLADVNDLARALADLAQDERVQAVILDPGAQAAVAAAYDAWDAAPLSVEAANDVAAAIKASVIAPTLDAYPAIRNLVLVGSDDLLPYFRQADPTRLSDRLYTHVPADTPMAAALASDHFLTDDYYASRTPRLASGRPLYLPDLAVGRLVEQPAEIMAQVAPFLAEAQPPGPALIAGYGFMQDAGQVEGDVVAHVGPPPHYVLGGDWRAEDLRDALDDAHWSLLALNQHATHWSLGAPVGEERLTVADLDGLDSLAGALALSPGCQAGLSLPDGVGDPAQPRDWPQSFAGAGSAFMGNTGFGWGVRGVLGYSERLNAYVVAELAADGETTVGQALVRAKKRYRAVAGELDALDEKVLQEFTLYGIPQSRPALVRSVTQASIPEEAPLVVNRPGEFDPQIYIRHPKFHFKTVQDTDSVPRLYAYNRDPRDGVWIKAGWPALPQETLGLMSGDLHGVIISSAVYTDTVDVRPFTPHAENEVAGVDTTDAYPTLGWSPARLVSFSQVEANRQNIHVVEGQYRLGVMRLYSELTITAYQSESDDWTPPLIESVEQDGAGDTITVTVRVSDDRAMHAVFLSYTEDRVGVARGEWRSLALTPVEDGVWRATLPTDPPVRYRVQAVDGAGNVAVADNDGLYFRAPAQAGSLGRHCGGVGPLDEDFCACVWGAVRVDGEPVADAQVTLSFGGERLITHTQPGAVEAFPYYDLSGQDLGIRSGGEYTLTVSYGGYSETRRVIAEPNESSEQRVDFEMGAGRRVWVPVVWR